MRNANHKYTVPFKNHVCIAGSLIAALLLILGCGTPQPIITQKADPPRQASRNAAQKAYEYCESQIAPHAPTWRNNLETLNKSVDRFGEVGRESGAKVDQAHADSSDSGTQWGETAGMVFGAVAAGMAMSEQDQYRKKKMGDCMEALGYEVTG